MNNIFSSWTWTLPQTSQLQVTAKLNSNHNYQSLSKDFIEKYANATALGISYTEQYYNSNTSVSLHVHHTSNNQLHEVLGHTNFKNKLLEFNINTIKFSNISFTTQPLGKNSVVITMTGRVEINNNNYTSVNTFIVKINSGTYKILNHIFEIFI
jgi:hypothetical protein